MSRLAAILALAAAPAFAPDLPVELHLTETEPNICIGWVWPPYCAGVARLESSHDLREWQAVAVITNPFPDSPAVLTVVGFHSTNHFFRLSPP